MARFLWPRFVVQHDCVFVLFADETADFNPPPKSDTVSSWESFVNHTHIFDEFRNKATNTTVIDQTEDLDIIENEYDETHPDFIAACELGKLAARTWSLKLHLDFPSDRFRVYYTEYDNPIVRFHKVRPHEPFFASNEDFLSLKHSDFRNGLIYDTAQSDGAIFAPRDPVN